MLTKTEVMKRMLRGDFSTLHKLATNDYGNTSNIYWAMRGMGWHHRGGGFTNAAEKDMTGNGAWAQDGSKWWYADLNEVLRCLGYVDAQ